MSLCNPALLYFILAIMSILMMIVKKCSATSIIGQIIGVVLWTWFLNFVCGKGFTNISWALVLAPYVIIFVALITGIVSIADLQEMQKPPQQQQPVDKKETLVIL